MRFLIWCLIWLVWQVALVAAEQSEAPKSEETSTENAAPVTLPQVEVNRFLTPEISAGFTLNCEKSTGTEPQCKAMHLQNGKPVSTTVIRLAQANDIVNRFLSSLPESMVTEQTPGNRDVNTENEGGVLFPGMRVSWNARGGNKVSQGTITMAETGLKKVDPDRDLAFQAIHFLERALPSSN